MVGQWKKYLVPSIFYLSIFFNQTLIESIFFLLFSLLLSIIPISPQWKNNVNMLGRNLRKPKANFFSPYRKTWARIMEMGMTLGQYQKGTQVAKEWVEVFAYRITQGQFHLSQTLMAWCHIKQFPSFIVSQHS